MEQELYEEVRAIRKALENKESIVLTSMHQPIHITVTKNAKGDYQWELSIHSTIEGAPQAKECIDILDESLRQRYGRKEA